MGTHRVTVDLAEQTYQHLRNAVDSGEYASESDAIEDSLMGMLMEPAVQEGPEFERWLREDVAAAYDELEADPSSGLTSEQVRASLAEERLARR